MTTYKLDLTYQGTNEDLEQLVAKCIEGLDVTYSISELESYSNHWTVKLESTNYDHLTILGGKLTDITLWNLEIYT